MKSSSSKYTDLDFQNKVLGIQKQLQELGKEVVVSSFSYYQTKAPSLVGNKGDSVLIVANLFGNASDDQTKIEKIRKVVSDNRNSSFSLYDVGSASVNKDFQDLAEKDLAKAEVFGLPVALVILIIVFGAVTAAIIPMILSFLAIGLALAITAVVGQFLNLSFFVTNMITMMGLAVGIDYSLFVVSRFREERAHGVEKLQAISNSSKTAGKAIFFSGITVVLALSGLLLVPSNIFTSLSVGAIFVVMAAVFAALTLLPALLSLLGDKVNALALPFIGNKPSAQGTAKGFWSWVSKIVMNYAWFGLVASGGLLIWATIPLIAINIGFSGISSLPKDLPSKEGFVILQNDFSSGLLSPSTIVVDGDPTDIKVNSALKNLNEKLSSRSEVGTVQSQAYPDKKLSVLTVPISGTTQEQSNIVASIRKNDIPSALENSGAKAYISGQIAENLDFTNIVRDHSPWVFAFVLSLSFLLLMLVFRSIVVPIKAIIMNLLSVGAAYGILVAVFQRGIGNKLFGFQQADQIESWIPLFLFAILFGLSMDYHVFLLSRIREHFNKTKNNNEAVAFGLATTGRMITGAALIMVAVFSAFAAGSLVMFQQVGFGLAVSIFLDATLVRSILVPASMKLLGNWNWYLPNWLSWLPRIGIGE